MPDILVVLQNLAYRLHYDGRGYDYKVVIQAIKEIKEIKEKI